MPSARSAVSTGSITVDLLAAQMAAFARMRIESQHRDHRIGDAEIATQRSMSDAQCPLERLWRDRIGDRAQRQVSGDQRDADDVVGQHHHHIAAGMVGEQFGSAAVGDAAFVDDGLVHRAGDQAIEFATQAVSGGLLQGADHGVGVAWVGRAEDGSRGVRDFNQREFTRACAVLIGCDQRQRQTERIGCGVQAARIGKNSQGVVARLLGEPHAQFRPDAGRFARDQREPDVRHRGSAAVGGVASAGVVSAGFCSSVARPLRMSRK